MSPSEHKKLRNKQRKAKKKAELDNVFKRPREREWMSNTTNLDNSITKTKTRKHLDELILEDAAGRSVGEGDRALKAAADALEEINRDQLLTFEI